MNTLKPYPVNLNLAEAKCLVVGGGRVAERKVLGLLPSAPSITVISPRLTKRLGELYRKGRIEHIGRKYHPKDLKGYSLVFAATNDPVENREIAARARALGIWVNVATASELSTFSNPSVIRRGKLLFTVSTEGLAPALSKRIAKELEGVIGREFEAMTTILGALRAPLKEQYTERERRRIVEELLSSDVLALLKERRYREAMGEVERITGLSPSALGIDMGKAKGL